MAEALKAEGNKLLQAGDNEGAVKKYTEAIAIDPKNHVYFSNRSAAFLKMNKPLEAVEDAVKAIEIKPTWAKGYSRKGAALYSLNRMEEAKICYEEAVKLDPNNASFKAELERCKSHLTGPGGSQPMGNMGGMGSPDEIFKKLSTDPRTKAFMSDPSYLQMLQELSANPANAMKHMSDPRMQATLQVMFGVNLGADKDGNPEVIPTKKTETPAASTSSSSAPKFSMDDMDTSGPTETKKPKQEEPKDEPMPQEENQAKLDAKKLKDEGNAFYKKKQFDQAIEKYDKAIELDSTEIVFFNNKAAVIFEKLKIAKSTDFSECREVALKAVDVGRENRADYKNIAKALKRVAACYEKENDHDNAIKWYNKSLTEHREKEIVQLVQKLEKTKKESARKAYFDSEKAEAARAEGNEFFKKGKFPEAIKCYDEGMKRTPDDDKETMAKFYSNRAGCYMKLMEFHRAQKDCEESLKLKPDFVKCWIRKGAVFEALKQHDNALEAFRTALELDPNAAEAKNGMNRVMTAKYASRNDPEATRQRAMNDPEVQQIMGDPSMRMILEQMQSNPQAAAEHMKNPDIARKIQKLVDVGLISVSSR